MPEAAKPRKGSKRGASSPSAKDASKGTEVQTGASPSPGGTVSQEAGPEASTQGKPPAAEPPTPTGQEELTREQLERLRNRLKTRYHS